MQEHLIVEEGNIYFGNSQILKNINCSFERNKITTIMGSSGCGKSTLIKSFNRINELNEDYRFTGKILYHGENLVDIPLLKLRQSVAMVFQRPVVFPHISIIDNVLIGIRARKKIKKKNALQYAKKYLKQAYLWSDVKECLDRNPLSLSGGQQQRLCIARSLAQSPEILLLDEPCSALDPASTLLIEELLISLTRSLNFIIVTHNIQQAKKISDKVILLLKSNNIGYIAESGSVTDIFEQPKNLLTERFLNAQLTD